MPVAITSHEFILFNLLVLHDEFVNFRPGKVDLQFIVKAFLKRHAGRRSFIHYSLSKFFNV